VAEALGYKAARNALAQHVDEGDKTTVAICDTGSNYKTQAIFINVSGLYSLILSSKLLNKNTLQEKRCKDM
jgi:prophage antirepressor-like protein